MRPLSLLLSLSVLAAPAALHADELTGQFSVEGALTDTGTTLDFMSAMTSDIPATFTGSFMTLLTPSEAVTASQPALFYSPYASGTEVFGIGPLSVTLESFAETAAHNFAGTAMLSAAGYSSTMADIYLSSQASGAVTFSATTIATPAPEPSTLALLGSGGLVAAGLLRRRFAQV